MRKLTKIEKASVVYEILSSGGVITLEETGTLYKLYPSGTLGFLPADEAINDAIGDGTLQELLARDAYVFERRDMTLTEFADFCDMFNDNVIRNASQKLGRKLQ